MLKLQMPARQGSTARGLAKDSGMTILYIQRTLQELS